VECPRSFSKNRRTTAIVSVIDNERPPQAAAWGEFLATYKKENAECHVEIGLTQIPRFSELNEQNFLAVKALPDLMEAGVRRLQSRLVFEGKPITFADIHHEDLLVTVEATGETRVSRLPRCPHCSYYKLI
jgi:hypothetical protein